MPNAEFGTQNGKSADRSVDRIAGRMQRLHWATAPRKATRPKQRWPGRNLHWIAKERKRQHQPSGISLKYDTVCMRTYMYPQQHYNRQIDNVKTCRCFEQCEVRHRESHVQTRVWHSLTVEVNVRCHCLAALFGPESRAAKQWHVTLTFMD